MGGTAKQLWRTAPRLDEAIEADPAYHKPIATNVVSELSKLGGKVTKYVGLGGRRAGPPGCARIHSPSGGTSTTGLQEIDQRKHQKGRSGNIRPLGKRLMDVNEPPDRGCHGYGSSRTSVPWVFCRLVVQPFQAALIARIPDPGRLCLDHSRNRLQRTDTNDSGGISRRKST